MDIAAFAIWKFRFIEGLLRDMYPSEVKLTKYVHPTTKQVTLIRYDYRNEVASIESPRSPVETVPFARLIDRLKELDMYVEMDKSKRHRLAGIQDES